MKTNTTIQQAIIASKCRKGKAHAITAKGAYWLAHAPIIIKRYGGDGIGQTRADMTNTMEIRHYRDGKVKIFIRVSTWHQNEGTHTRTRDASHMIDSKSVEDIIIWLKNTEIGATDYDDSSVSYSDYRYDDVATAFMTLGLPEFPIPSPDDETATP